MFSSYLEEYTFGYTRIKTITLKNILKFTAAERNTSLVHENM